ncbi:unnamed protein product, partial [Rotaria sp. Silwood2]
MESKLKSTSNKNNPGTFWQIWLFDLSNNAQKIVDTVKEGPSSTDHIRIFENIVECEQFIRSLSGDNRILFIADILLGQQIIPQIHQLRQVFAIYIYSTEEQANELWCRQFKKFRGIYTQLNKLIASIPSRYSRRPRRDMDESFVFSILNANIDQEQSTTELDGRFVHSQLLIDALQRMKSTSTEIEEFVYFCLNQKDIKDPNAYPKLVQEFQKEYKSNNSVWWYTRDSFVYRMLNKALRLHNVDVLFLFRFFIRDLAEQPEENQLDYPTHVDRGQSLSTYELKKLQQSVGKMISINSFLSTTLYP